MKKYRQSAILDRLSTHSNLGSKIAKSKPKGYQVKDIRIKIGEALKCTGCGEVIRTSRGHRKAYIIVKTGSTTIYSIFCYECKTSYMEAL